MCRSPGRGPGCGGSASHSSAGMSLPGLRRSGNPGVFVDKEEELVGSHYPFAASSLILSECGPERSS